MKARRAPLPLPLVRLVGVEARRRVNALSALYRRARTCDSSIMVWQRASSVAEEDRKPLPT